MASLHRLGGAAALILFSIACSKEPAPAAAPPATAAPAVTAPAATVAAAVPAAAGETGVAECDSFLTKYYACVESNVPEASRAQVRASVDMMKAQWKQAAVNPQAKAALATGCAQSEAAAKQSMAAYKCSW